MRALMSWGPGDVFSIKKHKDTKEQSFILDTKATSDLEVATKPCGWKSLLSLCILVFNNKKTLYLCDSVFINYSNSPRLRSRGLVSGFLPRKLTYMSMASLMPPGVST